MAKSKEDLKNYLENENVQWFLHNILKYESDSIKGKINYGGFNQNAGNSSAFGAGQFIGSTRNEVLNAYGVDAWSKDFKEQLTATIALLDMDGDLEKVANGDFESVFGVGSGGSRWQAFYPKGHKDYVKSSKNSILLGERPGDWKKTYNSQLNNAVYDPKYSWNKISPKIRDEKAGLYQRRYKDTEPDTLIQKNFIVPDIIKTPPPKKNIMEGFDTDPEIATQDQTQQVQPVVPEIEPKPPTIDNVPSVDDWMIEKKKEKIKERKKEEEKKQEVYEEEVVEEEVVEQDDEDIKAETEKREAKEAEKLKLEEEKYFKEQEEKKKQEKRDARVVEGDELPETIIEDEAPVGLTPKTTIIPQEETELPESIGKQEIVTNNKEEEEQRRLENIGVEQTQDIEVIDSNGKINTITTPVAETKEEFPGLLPEVKVTDQPEIKTEPEEKASELVKPQMKDFRSSGEYMKARRKYYQQIEEPEDYIENELTDDEVIEHVNRERSKAPIDSAARNIFNTSSGNNIFNTIIGEVDDLLEGISNSVQVKGSLMSQDDEDKITTVTGGFGPSGMTRTETTTTREGLKAQKEFEKSQDLGELNITDATKVGEEQTVPSEIEKRISAEEQEALDLVSEFEKEKKEKIIKDSKLTGNFYNERQSILSDMDIGINKSTIETLALKNPDDLNIENGVVTDNAGNIIQTKDDWLNFASKPKDKGGLGMPFEGNPKYFNSSLYNTTSNQFKTEEYKYMKNINKQIDGAWDYFKTSVATETGILPADVLGWLGIAGENETIDFGKYENEIKKEFLNGIDLGDITKYYNEEKSAFTRLPIIESMSLKEKETRIEAAKSVVLQRQMKILNKAGDDITLRRDGLEKQEKNLINEYEEYLKFQEKVQNDLNILEEKHGTWSYDQSGKRVYVPYIDKSRWPQGDKSSLKSINESIRQIGIDRIDLNNDRKKYFKDKETYNTIAKDFNTQREELLMRFGWDSTTMMFDPAFKQTEINKKFRESYREVPWIGRPLDIVMTGAEGYYKLLLAGKAIGAGFAGVVNPFAWAAAAVGYIAEDSGTLDYFYEFGPSKKSEVNKGYTHAGQLWDGLLQVWGKEWAPISEDPEGEWMVKGYESDKETWGGRWLDNFAGGGSNMTLYSGAKGLARLAPYIMHISKAGKDLVTKTGGPGKKVLKQREAVGKFAGTTKDLLASAGQVKLGRSIAASMNKSFLTSQRFTGILEMNKINYRITLLDNIADGRARGLSHADAFTYGNALSFITGLTQSIMPDYLYFRGKDGGLYKEFASNAVKSLTGKTMSKIAHREALKKSTSQFFSSYVKEQIEEYLDVGGHDLVKSFYIAGHSPEIAKAEVNAEIFRATTMMTVPLAGMGAVATHRNTKATVYNHFYRNATEAINYGNKNITALDYRLKNLTNSKKDRALKKILEAEKKVVETQLAASEDIRRAINVAPDMVTDTQLDLLIQKHKLLDERTKLKNKDKVANKGRFQELTDEITKIDEKIEENSIENYQETLYDRLYENSLALAKKMGWTIEHVDIDTSTKEGKEEYFKYVELQQKKRRKQNADIDKQIEEIKKEHKGKTLPEEVQAKIDKLEGRKRAIPQYDSPGFIDYDDETGRHHIIIDKSKAMAGYDKNSAVMLHELLHAALRQTVRNNPNAIKGMSYMLREELINNPERYNVPGFTGAEMSVVGKFDAYKKEVGNMAFDEMFSIITESMAQGNIKIETGLISKISDFVRRIFREIGVNFQITETDEMINFLRDFNNEVLSGRKQFSRGMRKIIKDGRTSAIGGRPLIKVSQDAINKAKDTEKTLLELGKIKEIWNPQYAGAALSLGGKVGRISVYDQQQLKRDLKLSENTKKIVEENERLRKLILEEGIKDGKKIVASEDLQTRIVENNLPMAMGLAKFAANNPKIMGLEEGKRVTYEQFLSGYYLQLSNLARTYDASVNEFGQYLNTILPLRYGEILEAEKKGAMEGAKGLDFIPDIPVDPDDDVDLTPNEVSVGPKVDTAKRLQIKDKTKPFIDKGLAQIRKLQDLQVKISEKYNEKTVEEIAEITADLESKGMIDLDIESLTVKKAPNLLYKFVAKEFGIDEDKLNPNSKSWLANLRKKEGKRGGNEVRAAQRAVAKNPEVILSTVFNEGHTAAFKSSGMPNSLLKFGYNKGSKRINNNFPQYKKPNLSETDLLKFVGVEKVTRKGITGYKFTVDRNTGTKLLAIAQMVDRNMSLQAINESLEETGNMTAKIKNSIQDGLANASKSIYYRNNVELQSVIRERLPLLGFKLQNVDDNWTTKQIKDVIMEVYKDTDVKAAFANDLLKKTAVINKYKLLKRSSIARKETPISLDEFLEQEFASIDIFEGVMAMLGISVDRKEDLYTKDNIKSVRKQVGDFAFMVDKLEEENQKKIKEIDSSTKEGKKEIARLKREAMELLFLFEQQHITAAKMGNGLYQAVAGTNDLVLKNKVGKQRDQVFGSEDGAPTDFRLFVNQRMNNLQMPLSTTEANQVKKDLGISKLFAQKSKAVIESIMNGKFDFNGRTAEAIIARKLVKMQMKFYAKLYKKGEITNEHYMMHMLTFGSSMSTVSRRAASLYGIQEGILSNGIDGKYIYGKIENAGKELEFEHGKPHGHLILELNQTVLNEKESSWDAMMDEIFTDYKVNIITKRFDDVLTLSGVKDRMVPTGQVYEKGKEHGWEQRLYSKLTLGHPDVKPIISLDGKKTRHGQSFSKSINVLPKSVAEINVDKKISKGIESARSINYTNKIKGITVLDFDDTLATTESLVKFTRPDGTTGTLNAEQYASTYENLLDKGFTFDFSDFNKVVKGKLAPLFQKALKLQKKFGSENMFVLTARPPAAQKPIFDFLKANGLNIPLKNITGLANSTSEAKALWMAEKVGEGYNDFYFADDALQNVQAVDNVLSQFDVKRKIQQAKVKFSKGALSTKQDLNWKEDSIGYMTTNFDVDGNNYKITLYPTDLNDTNYELEFDLVTEKGLTQEMTGTGNQFKVLGIVYNGLLDVVKQKPNIETIGFSALTKDKSRARVYTILMDKLGKKLGWKTDIYEYESGTQLDFEVAKPKTRKARTKTTESIRNIPAVKNILNQSDVKSPTQQAKASFSIDYDNQFNKILEQSKGVDAEKRFSKAKARMRGAEKGQYQIFIPPSAEDFVGLIYYFLGKGKQGEKQFDFFKKTLIDPLNRAYRSLNSARQAIADDYKKLQKQFPEIRKNLYKKLPGTEFTYGDAIRVYLWDKAGFNIPGLSPTDQKKLASIINNDPDLKAYADTLSVISRAEDGYVEPSDNWLIEDIRVDLMNGMAKIHRKKFFAEFLENVKVIFSEQNLNKIEAIYGSNFVEALKDMLYRIENGTNRSFGSNRLVNRFMNWINGSIGTTMFFNSRSAILQTLSTVNFINWSDNNVLAAAKAFANQPQFWSDFSMIFNSTFLKQRRAGLTLDLNASEIADYVSNSKSPIKSALNYLLQKGFLPTQIADSFAIAVGGATFYRNRVNKYLVEGMTNKEAEEQAFLDMQGIAEETQQSARPDRISQQQASVLGRIILAFQNTPMQYTRLMKKAILDLKDGRGDAKTNISKIIYYGAIQNIIFYSLQTALFAMMFGDDDDEEFFDKKKERVLNGTLDSTLRGMGVGGAVVSTVKNMALKFLEEQDKPRYRKNENAVLLELLNLSPPIGIKARQIQMGTRTLNWNQDTIEEMPLYNLDNPIWEAGFNYTQALTNVPVARMHTKVTNLREAANKENEAWQRIAIFMGWSKWNLGVKSKKTKKTSKKKRKRLILR